MKIKLYIVRIFPESRHSENWMKHKAFRVIAKSRKATAKAAMKDFEKSFGENDFEPSYAYSRKSKREWKLVLDKDESHPFRVIVGAGIEDAKVPAIIL